ncbi:MAG: DinB family protein [Planctomycetes bacterium]|nr:DinB family protein [Planctomycetota bacterium]
MSGAWEGFAAELSARIDRAFLELDQALVAEAALAERRPAPDAWSLAEIAEHVVRTDHHLLLLAGKLARKARERAAREDASVPRSAPGRAFTELERLAQHDFRWAAPEHMLPRGELDLAAARRVLRADRERGRAILASMPPGAGVLASARFSPLDLRFDAYQFLALVAAHAERHARQARRGRGALEGHR